ncbi:nicotinate-nucleotide adenylyltransferase [Rubritalea squalenifaciens DSM 18772]|uniref:Probable nicotinate-nucleotide adenylyltransferase n=1 Tax=Rubritalea squalenifaciens DSM 18772 TaxID=1123071 RepID=A0A1M6I7B8_9BACT|nr:nicotinate (nicotinamide) nucleotide adenylyltransferase [Rubritalea squalenifaciens]SHJ30273.1 nicotinate-nucleotide adenylyltransferase [Rubritalea squalenifaciens DSM 18772]
MPVQKTKICLIGGTFDPIHLGHTYIAAEAKRRCSLDKVIFLPCKQSPHKMGGSPTADAHRLAMCQLATQGFEWAEVDDFDLCSPPPSYSWRTAEHFKTLYPAAELYWLMGTDQWNSLPRWNRPDHFASLVKFIVYTRNQDKPQEYEQYQCTLLQGIHPASATAIRNHPKSASSIAWLNPAVQQYILKNKLYSADPP